MVYMIHVVELPEVTLEWYNWVGLIHGMEQNGMECSIGLKHGTEPILNHSIYNAFMQSRELLQIMMS